MADMKIGHPDPTRVDSISRKKPGNTHLRRIPSWYQDCDALSHAVHDVQTTDSPRDPSAFARPAPAGASARITMTPANRDVRAAAQALSGGVFAYVPKPFDFKQLDHLVALALATPQPTTGGQPAS